MLIPWMLTMCFKKDIDCNESYKCNTMTAESDRTMSCCRSKMEPHHISLVASTYFRIYFWFTRNKTRVNSLCEIQHVAQSHFCRASLSCYINVLCHRSAILPSRIYEIHAILVALYVHVCSTRSLLLSYMTLFSFTHMFLWWFLVDFFVHKHLQEVRLKLLQEHFTLHANLWVIHENLILQTYKWVSCRFN